MLVKFVCSKKTHWSSYLDTCVFAYNTSRQESTKFTPFELMFGRKATLPVDINVRKKEPSEVLTNYLESKNNIDHHRKEKQLQQLEEAKSNILAAQKKQKETYDRKRAIVTPHAVGTFVLVKDFMRKKRKGGKLDQKWLGPYKIEKTLPRGIYVISLLNDQSKIRSVSGAHIKVYTTPTSVQVNTTEQSQEKSGSEHDSSQLSKSRSLSQPYKGSYSKHQFSDNSNSSQLSHVSYNEL